uniref:Uncharacterized protein n=1 Tax=Molossus molossus TaxID=27622 RepID=A0A7J8ERD0_MOLMO|nr:hypothetical protein HJG59_008681 [Molossus molossus]
MSALPRAQTHCFIGGNVRLTLQDTRQSPTLSWNHCHSRPGLVHKALTGAFPTSSEPQGQPTAFPPKWWPSQILIPPLPPSCSCPTFPLAHQSADSSLQSPSHPSSPFISVPGGISSRSCFLRKSPFPLLRPVLPLSDQYSPKISDFSRHCATHNL